MDAALLRAEIDRLYVTWGVEEVRGLEMDGAPATPESLADGGAGGAVSGGAGGGEGGVRAVGG